MKKKYIELLNNTIGLDYYIELKKKTPKSLNATLKSDFLNKQKTISGSEKTLIHLIIWLRNRGFNYDYKKIKDLTVEDLEKEKHLFANPDLFIQSITLS